MPHPLSLFRRHGYGGTERVVSLLTEELVRRGHEVTLFASGDSTTAARLVPTVDTALWRLDEVRDPLPYWTITVGEAYQRAADGEFDVMHSHLDFQAFACALSDRDADRHHAARPARSAGPCAAVRPLPNGGCDLDLGQPARAAAACELARDGLQRRRYRQAAVQPARRRLSGVSRADLAGEGAGHAPSASRRRRASS